MAAKNSGKQWISKDVAQLRSLAVKNTPTRVIGIKLGRSPDAIQAKATEKHISLKPNNRSPYGTRRGR